MSDNSTNYTSKTEKDLLPPGFEIIPSNIEKLVSYGKNLGESFIVYAKVHIASKEISKEVNVQVNITQNDLEHTHFTIQCPIDTFSENNIMPLENASKLYGARATVQFVNFGQTQSLLTGQVTRISTIKNEKGVREIYLHAQSYTHLMDADHKQRSFENMTLEEIIKQLLQPYTNNDNFTARIRPLFNSKIPYVVQNQTDWQFLQFLCKKYGEYMQFNGEELIIGEFAGDVIVMNERKDFYSYEIDSFLKPQAIINKSYHNLSSDRLIAHSEKINFPRMANTYQFRSVEASQKIYTDPDSLFSNNNRLDRAGIELDELTLKQGLANQNTVFLKVKSNKPSLRLGDIVKMKVQVRNHPIFDDGFYPIESYRIISINQKHNAAEGYSNEFVAVPREQEVPFYTDIQATTYSQEQHAVVADNNDPEGLNRVRVRFYWAENNELSPWILLAQPYSGAGFGAHFVPEIGTEVLVGFVNKDAQLPYVICSLYNGKQKSGFHTQDNSIKAIYTSSGHILKFTEHESILLSDKSGNELIFDTTKGNMTITAPETLTLNCKNMNMNILEDMNVAIGNNKTENIQGNTTARIGKQYYLSADNIVESTQGKRESYADNIEEIASKITKSSTESNINIQSKTQVNTNSSEKSKLF